MDYTKGLISENSDNTSGGRSLGGINSGDYTAYYNVDFGKTGCSKVKLRYSRKTEDAEKKGENRNKAWFYKWNHNCKCSIR